MQAKSQSHDGEEEEKEVKWGDIIYEKREPAPLAIVCTDVYGRALQNFQSTKQGDLQMLKGDLIQIVRKNKHIWEGINISSKRTRGTFPETYVTELTASEAKSLLDKTGPPKRSQSFGDSSGRIKPLSTATFGSNISSHRNSYIRPQLKHQPSPSPSPSPPKSAEDKQIKRGSRSGVLHATLASCQLVLSECQSLMQKAKAGREGDAEERKRWELRGLNVLAEAREAVDRLHDLKKQASHAKYGTEDQLRKVRIPSIQHNPFSSLLSLPRAHGHSVPRLMANPYLSLSLSLLCSLHTTCAWNYFSDSHIYLHTWDPIYSSLKCALYNTRTWDFNYSIGSLLATLQTWQMVTSHASQLLSYVLDVGFFYRPHNKGEEHGTEVLGCPKRSSVYNCWYLLANLIALLSSANSRTHPL